MLRDYCVICKTLNTEKIEIAFAYKRECEDLVVIKKIYKMKCNKEVIRTLRSELFSEDYIEEMETDEVVVRIEKKPELERNIILSSVMNCDDGIMFFTGKNLIYLNEKQKEFFKCDDCGNFKEIEETCMVKDVRNFIDKMDEENMTHLSKNITVKLKGQQKSFLVEMNRMGNQEGNSFMILCKDKTAEYLAKKSLEKMNHRLNAVLEGSQSGVFEMDEEGNSSIWISYDICNVLGYEPEEGILSEELVKTYIHPEDFDKSFITLKRDTLDQKVVCRELRLKDASGAFRWFSLVAYAVKLDSVSTKIIGSLTDIHQRKIASLSLVNSNKALEEEREMNKLMTEFFGNISHDFKTPLNLIINSLKLLKNSFSEYFESEEQGKRYFEIIQQNCYRLIKLVNNLLDISRIESGFYSLSLNNGNIVSIIEDTTLSVREYTRNRGINLIFDTEFEEEIICFDNEKIERIMLNILSNSIKFTKDGGDIKVFVSKENDFVKVLISDTGIGIPKCKLMKIFDRFEQAHEGSARVAGTGIGLALVKSLVEMHGGTINMQSIENEGTEVSFLLPIRTIQEDDGKEFMKSKFDIDKVFVELSDV